MLAITGRTSLSRFILLRMKHHTTIISCSHGFSVNSKGCVDQRIMATFTAHVLQCVCYPWHPGAHLWRPLRHPMMLPLTNCNLRPPPLSRYCSTESGGHVIILGTPLSDTSEQANTLPALSLSSLMSVTMRSQQLIHNGQGRGHLIMLPTLSDTSEQLTPSLYIFPFCASVSSATLYASPLLMWQILDSPRTGQQACIKHALPVLHITASLHPPKPRFWMELAAATTCCNADKTAITPLAPWPFMGKHLWFFMHFDLCYN